MAKMKKRADGRYQKVVENPKTKQKKTLYGKTLKEINQKISAFYEECDRVKPFNEIAIDWWWNTENQFASQTLKSYKAALNRSLKYFDQVPIDQITTKDINGFLLKMAKDGLAHKTVMNQKTVLNQIFDYAVIMDEISNNPCNHVTIPKNLKKGRRSAASEREEQIVKNSPDICLIPFIAIYTGMRKGEILALQWKDIDFERDRINVTKSVYHEGNTPHIKSPKTEAGTRLVPLLKPLKDVLFAIEERPPNDFIISDDGKKPLTKKRYDLIYNSFRKKTGVKSGVHQLRHSFATIAFECDVPAKTVQEILGHKDVSTTINIYTDFREKSFNKAAEILNEKFAL